MIWVILAVLVGLAALSLIKVEYSDSFGWMLLSALSVLAAIVVFVIGVIAMVLVVDAKTVDERIAMYEEENQRIEEQITDVVAKYQEYETGIFSEVTEKRCYGFGVLVPRT